MTKSTRKNIISAIITVLILLVGFIASEKLKSQKKSTVSDKIVKKDRRKVPYSTFEKGDEANLIQLDGRLKAHQVVNITSKVQGIMQPSSKTIKEGMYYKKGDILFSVDKTEASYNMKAQKSSLLTSITQMMPDLKFDHPASFANWQSYLNDFDINRSIAELPKPVTDQEKYFVSGRNIYNQFYNIKSVETRLKEYTTYAPFSGVITALKVYPGALINPGQVIATMINTNRYEIASPVPLENLKYISLGQKVDLRSDELDKNWKGSVNRIGSQIDETTQSIPVYINVTGQGLKDGVYLKGQLNGKSLSDVTRIPKDIFVTPNSLYAIVDSTVTKVSVNTIKRTDKNVIVDNLDPNLKIITGSLAGLLEGQKVNY